MMPACVPACCLEYLIFHSRVQPYNMYQLLSITMGMSWAVFALETGTWNDMCTASAELAQQVALAGCNSYVVWWNPVENRVGS